MHRTRGLCNDRRGPSIYFRMPPRHRPSYPRLDTTRHARDPARTAALRQLGQLPGLPDGAFSCAAAPLRHRRRVHICVSVRRSTPRAPRPLVVRVPWRPPSCAGVGHRLRRGDVLRKKHGRPSSLQSSPPTSPPRSPTSIRTPSCRVHLLLLACARLSPVITPPLTASRGSACPPAARARRRVYFGE